MINLEVLKSIIVESQEHIADIAIINRQVVIEKHANYVFTGPRRAGKTFFIYQLIQMKHAGNDDFLFVNFEDERLIEFSPGDFDLLLEAYNQLYDGKPVLYFDEVQNIPGWEKFCRRMADSNYQVYVTGSNAKMLSAEIATTLGGRFLIKEISPLSFNEFLQFNELVLQKHFQYTRQKTMLVKHMEQYLTYGGFPESLKYNDKRSYLSNVFQKVFYGDIIARHKLKNDFALKMLIKKIAESVNNETSFNRIKNIINSTGIKVGTGTLIEYFNYLEDSFLVFSIKNYTSKFTERETKKKFYFIDTGVLNLFLINQNSKLLENAVYLALKRQLASEIYYYKRKHETDFYIPETGQLIQVSYSVKDYQTRERELNSLKAAMKDLNINKGLIITYDEEEKITDREYSISVLPFWKWVLKS
ncbi:MAG: ATP-binding protein [bacterium]